MADQEIWYYSHDGQDRQGPVTWGRIQEYFKGGILSPETLIWAPHLPEWTPAQRLIRAKRGMATPLKVLLIVAGCLLATAVLGGLVHAAKTGGVSEDRLIRIVRNGHLRQYPDKPIGKAVDGFFGDPKWESGTAEDGNSIVNVLGTMRYMDKPVNARVQFVVDESNRTFEVYAFEMNGIPQNDIMKQVLIAKMHE